MTIQELEIVFNKIKSKGFIKSTRPNNTDGGIGNTFEDELEIIENNSNTADFNGFEVKTKRALTSSYLSLFCKSPSFPNKANSILRENYGEVRDPEYPTLKKLYASIFGHNYSSIYSKYEMKLEVDRVDSKVFLCIKDNIIGTLNRDCYWTFEALKRASSKMKSLFFVFADEEKRPDGVYFHYNSAKIYSEFDFNKFINMIESGKVMFDIRIGYYKSGPKFGKTHDHGSGFRVKANDLQLLYATVCDLN